MINNMNRKRGLSPVIATMLLVVIVIVIAIVVFVWFRGITEEVITKFNDKNIRLVCDEIELQASYDSETLSIVNIGNVPVYKIKARTFLQGNYQTVTLTENWPATGLNQGGAYSGPLSGDFEKILLIPVLLGNSERGELAHTCEEKNGEEIII
jgi:flagellin-like protein